MTLIIHIHVYIYNKYHMAFLILRTKMLEITQCSLLNQVSCPSDVTQDLSVP